MDALGAWHTRCDFVLAMRRMLGCGLKLALWIAGASGCNNTSAPSTLAGCATASVAPTAMVRLSTHEPAKSAAPLENTVV